MKQKRITQSDYINDGRSFEPFIRESNVLLRNDEYIVIHLDGVHFTNKYFRGFSQKERCDIFKSLVNSTKELCKYLTSTRVAYVCGDEVSVILQGDLVKENYNNRIQKLCSIASSFLSVKLIQELKKLNNIHFDDFLSNCYFAGKIYNIPNSYINDYLKWRLAGCKKLIFDKHKEFDKCDDWEKYGSIITYDDNVWNDKSMDFRQYKFQKSPQCEYFNIKQ